MAALVPINDYISAGVGLLMSMYQSRPNVQALLTAFLGHHQRIEDALMQLIDGRTLADATGSALDGVGSLVGIARNGLTDDAYRVLITAKIAENEGDGTLQTVLRVTMNLFAASALFDKVPNTLGAGGQGRGAYLSLMVGSPGVPQSLYPLIVSLVQKSLPAGVELSYLGTFNASRSFAFAGGRAWVGGFGSIHDPTAGAPFASLLYNSPY